MGKIECVTVTEKRLLIPSYMILLVISIIGFVFTTNTLVGLNWSLSANAFCSAIWFVTMFSNIIIILYMVMIGRKKICTNRT